MPPFYDDSSRRRSISTYPHLDMESTDSWSHDRIVRIETGCLDWAQLNEDPEFSGFLYGMIRRISRGDGNEGELKCDAKTTGLAHSLVTLLVPQALLVVSILPC